VSHRIPLPTVQTALDNGRQVDALSVDCDNVSRLGLLKLCADGCGGDAVAVAMCLRFQTVADHCLRRRVSVICRYVVSPQ
jgi:hypothetical protein